jgi:hypothetical protein
MMELIDLGLGFTLDPRLEGEEGDGDTCEAFDTEDVALKLLLHKRTPLRQERKNGMQAQPPSRTSPGQRATATVDADPMTARASPPSSTFSACEK